MKAEARAYYDRKIESFADKGQRIFSRVIPSDISTIKKIHLSGVCGTAVGSLAVLLSKKGYKLSGSDTNCYPPMSDVIAALGIEFRQGFSGDHVKDADLVIIGNVCDALNPEAKYARENSIPTMSLPEAIYRFFIEGKKSIVVAGTHGKTTTTGLLSHVFSSAGKKPGYMIGGVMQGGEESSVVGEGNYFIIEGDEYDTAYFDKCPKFLHYAPHVAVITSIEFDHVDIYKNLNEYTDAFKFLVQEIPQQGSLFIWGDKKEVKMLGDAARCVVMTYGLNKDNNITASDIIVSEDNQEFNLYINGEDKGRLKLSLCGTHNLLNALAVSGIALQEGLTFEELNEGLASFKGMKRRQEIVAEINGITIIDDFAHHPTAVSETIKAIKSKYPERRLVAFFEPRSVTSRRKIFEEDYSHSFAGAGLVFISTPALRSIDNPDNFINPSNVVEAIKNYGIEAYSVGNAEELLEQAVPFLRSGDVILIMSNGSFDGIHGKLASRLRLAAKSSS
jgi:UDP-N-acetylmuramate: L-alanyl-gamma-D-glutamyl-meso-diaminopimelate ligase